MRALYILAGLFVLLALDLTQNNGGVFWTVNAYVDEIMRQFGLN